MIDKILKQNPIEDPAVLSRRARKKLNKKYEIIRAAQEIIEEKGYELASINEIAERADISYTTFFNYFSTKNDLLLGIEQTEYEDLYEILTIRHSNALSIRPVIEDLMQEWFSDNVRFSNVFLRVCEEVFIRHSEPYMDKSTMIFVHLIEEGQKRGEFLSDVSPRLVALELVGIIFSCVYSKYYENFSNMMKSVLDSIMM